MEEDKTNTALVSGGSLSLLVAALHVAIIIGGPEWYRFFGAGERMAVMAEQGQVYPILVTLGLALVFTLWAAYAWSGAGVLPRLPFLRFGLLAITAVYCVRGVSGFFVPFLSENPYVTSLGTSFWIWSTTISLGIGLVHLAGLRQAWALLRDRQPVAQAAES